MADVPATPAIVYIVDDDERTLRQVDSLLSTDGIQSRRFGSLVKFLDWLDYERLEDRVLIASEVDLPELGGLDLLNILNADGVPLPTVLMGNRISVPAAVEAMYAGASYILQKPFSDRAFRKAIKKAGCRKARGSAGRTAEAPIERRLMSLSPRQRQLLAYVFEGHTNKEIARRLAISQKTVELHRSAMMSKMGVTSLVELIRITATCDPVLYRNFHRDCA